MSTWHTKELNPADVVDPHERLKHLITYSNAMEVDYRIPPEKSGLEMVRQANVYHGEGSLENAYVLYLKFMTLFLEKIRKHPDFKNVPLKMKSANQEKLREILPKAERLKTELLKQYEEEYNLYINDLKRSPNQTPEQVVGGATNIRTDSHLGTRDTNKRYINVQPPAKLDTISYPDPQLARASSHTPSCPDISTPSFDRAVKPSRLTSINKDSLRAVKTPGKIMQVFQTMAQKNTIKNIETCGILAGKLERDELVITHLILPKQKGTPDSCTTLSEEELFDYQDQLNLITIGWIHTHPTQTAFLSSVDLHTHCPYQLLMPEAIAIVCAPRYNENKCFILTPHYGLNFIANCRQTGFHPHPTEPPLFEVAEHVIVVDGAPLEALDLR